jgi:hypothetical protein
VGEHKLLTVLGVLLACLPLVSARQLWNGLPLGWLSSYC